MQRTSEIPLEHASIVDLALTLARKVLTHSVTIKAAVAALVILLAIKATAKKKSIKGKTIVLTGAATGLGRAQAFELAKAGANLVVWDINMEQLEKTVADVREKYPAAKISAYAINLANREAVAKLAAQVQSEHGFVWGLINNAGIISGQSLMETPDKKIELTMAVNIMAHFWTVKAFLPEMMVRNDGHICAIASAAGFFPSARMVDYCTSKFAARGFMDALRIELSALGKSGVKTTLVAPAHINTDLFAGYSMGSTMQPEWVAQLVLDGIVSNRAVVFLPWLPLTMGNMCARALPARTDFFGRAQVAGHSADAAVGFVHAGARCSLAPKTDVHAGRRAGRTNSPRTRLSTTGSRRRRTRFSTRWPRTN